MPVKHPYIYHHTADHLRTCIRVYEKTNRDSFLEEPLIFSNVYALRSDRYTDAAFKAVRTRFPALFGSIPIIFSLEGETAYAWIIRRKQGILVGPVRFDTNVFFNHILKLEELGLGEFPFTEEWLLNVPVCSLRDFAAQVLLLFNMRRTGDVHAPFLSAETLLDANCVEHSITHKSGKAMVSRLLDNLENQIQHNPYDQELRERSSIRNGDVEGLRMAINESFSGKYGTLSEDPLRQEIDMGIVTMTLATRAAIDGGLLPENAFYICDMVIQGMEAAQDPVTVNRIYRNAEFTLAERVHELKSAARASAVSSENRHISRCKDYIFSHLHERLTVQEIADALSLDRSYLSRLFSVHEHVTIKQYIMREKIRLARNMLMYSTYDYSQIAAYLGFSSQSHLGTEFRKSTGMTLKDYRTTYAKEEFAETQFRNEQV